MKLSECKPVPIGSICTLKKCVLPYPSENIFEGFGKKPIFLERAHEKKNLRKFAFQRIFFMLIRFR